MIGADRRVQREAAVTSALAEPRVAAKFYKAVVQSLLLYGSETWNLTETVLARLEGFLLEFGNHKGATTQPEFF